MRRLLSGGSVVDGRAVRPMDVLMDDGRIVQTGTGLPGDAAQVVDVRGKLLFPGFIDAHTHFDLEVAGTVTADDFGSGSRAAILDGTTTVVDFATQYHGQTLQEAFARWKQKADGRSFCDYGFHMAISGWNPCTDAALADMIRAGIPSFKLYMTYDAMRLSDEAVGQVLARLKPLGGIAGVHCEDDAMIRSLTDALRSAGHMGPESHPLARPAEAEARAIRRLLELARVCDAPVIVVHVSSQAGLQAIQEARGRGQTVFAETCPQYLLLDQALYGLPDEEALRYIIAPPLRGSTDREALWQALARWEIQTIGSDHCSFTTAQKRVGMNDFARTPGGIPGVGTRAVLMHTAGVARGRLTLPMMCRLLSENVARLYGLYPQKGCIAPGSDADIVVFDPTAEGILHAADLAHRCDYTPFEGFPVKGRIGQVFLRGEPVVRDGRIVAAAPGGRFVPRYPLPQGYRGLFA